jgi:hypothetical protein
MFDKGLCPRCSLEPHLGALLGDPDARRRNGMAPLFDAFLAAPRPRAVFDWLYHNHKVADALGRMANGDLPLSHETLDSLEPMLGLRAYRHLGNLLMATGALPVRDSVLAALERWCDRELAAINHPEHARILRAYTRWQLLRPLRIKSQRALLHDATGYGARVRLRIPADFAAWLLTREHTLATCTQGNLEEWLHQHPTARAEHVRAFVTWAARRDMMPVVDVPAARTTLVAPVLSDERWSVARRLIAEPGIAATDRLAGSLVVIYAQPLARIARLTVHDIHLESACVTVRLGRVGVELPDPLSDVARDLLEQPRAITRKAKTIVDRGWLFVGADPGQPIRAESLGRRLQRHGVRAGPHRLAALYQLAADMPPSILAELLGIHPTTADRWSRLVSRPWRDYVALRADDDHHGDRS